jgi:acyl-CoA dehydrogenase
MKSTPGVDIIRPLSVLGYEDAPHGHAEIHFNNVRVPRTNLIDEIGAGFSIAQARLGPGRIHHCMRLIGHAERSLELACLRADTRSAFGSKLSEKGVVRAQLAECRIDIEACRLMVVACARRIDEVGAKGARKEIGMIKVITPRLVQRSIDICMQIHGGAGLSSDLPMAHMYAWARTLRLADGPDEVHIDAIGKQELGEQRLKRGDDSFKRK